MRFVVGKMFQRVKCFLWRNESLSSVPISYLCVWRGVEKANMGMGECSAVKSTYCPCSSVPSIHIGLDLNRLQLQLQGI